MTAPIFLLRPLPDSDQLTLEGEEGRHAATVRRLRVGERIDVTDGEGRVAECVVAAAARDRLELQVNRRTEEPAPQPHIVVVQALVKGDRSELAVELLTELGVDEIVPWEAQRCVATWMPEKSPRRWEGAAAAASKQSRRARWPIVAQLADTAMVQARLRASTSGFVLHEEATVALAGALPSSPAGEIVIVVGPEGGLTDNELAGFDTAGARAVRLGPSVLRASTAGCAAAAVVLAGCGRWR
jgi:16S rRNA (uracil1498-N3)-methyltransferase